MLKKILMLFLCVCLVMVTPVFAASEDAFLKTAEFVCELVSEPTVGHIGGEWAVIGLARSGYTVPEGYFDRYYANLKGVLADCNGVLHTVKYTEYARVVIALCAIGRNPENVAGYNLVEPICDTQSVVRQGINGAVFALIALDCGDFGENAEAARRFYVEYILKKQNADGGWSLSGEESDADVTGMALQALSKHREDDLVNKAVERAVLCLSGLQLDNGGYFSGGTENSECCVQVITALCELGISVKDSRFVKNGNTLVDNLLTYYVEGGGFKHTFAEYQPDIMASEQALYALSALDRTENGRCSLYDMSDVESVDIFEDVIGLPCKHADIKIPQITAFKKSFDDVCENKAEVEALAERGIVSGKAENKFEPYSEMTRAEFTAIIVNALGFSPSETEKFSDVKSGEWYSGFVGAAYSYGIISGISETEFAPGGTVTRQEAAVMITKAALLCGMDTGLDDEAARNVVAGFSDYRDVAEWAYAPMAFCYSSGIFSDDALKINPLAAVNRNEMAVMVYNLLVKAGLLRSEL